MRDQAADESISVYIAELRRSWQPPANLTKRPGRISSRPFCLWAQKRSNTETAVIGGKVVVEEGGRNSVGHGVSREEHCEICAKTFVGLSGYPEAVQRSTQCQIKSVLSMWSERS